MANGRRKSLLLRPGYWTSAAALILLSGCTQWPWRGGESHEAKKKDEVHRDDLSNYDEKLRPSGPKGNLDGLSPEANQIERNLGYR